MTVKSLPRSRGPLATLGLLLLLFGCGGDAKVQVQTGPGGGDGLRVSGLVELPNGQLSRSDGLLYRFARAVVAEAAALVADNVEPAGRNVVVTLYRVEERDVIGGQIRPSEELFQNSTNDDGQYDVVLPVGSTADTCRFMVQVGSASDLTLTRAFVFTTSAPIDISFESEATVRLILETIATGRADLCQFSAGDIENIYRAVVTTPAVVFGNDVAELNAAATNAARQSPRVQLAIAAALGGGPTVPPGPTDTRGPTEPPQATPTNTVRPVDTPTRTSGPAPTDTVPLPITDTPTERPTRTETATPTRTVEGAPTGTVTNTVVAPTSTVPPTRTLTSTPTQTTGVPTGTATATVPLTPTQTRAPTATVPLTPTQTRAPTATNTPMSAPPIGKHACALGAGSVIRLFTGFLARDLESTGTLEFECGSPGADGVAECSCGVLTFEPLNVPGIGFACLTPATAPCTAGKIDCNGGDDVGVDISGDHNKTFTCTSNADCRTKCTNKCGSPDNVVLSGCEGFCNDGTQKACRLDAECLPNDGACNGKENVPLGNVCECTCVDPLGPASRSGGLTCQLAFNLVVEAATASPPNCDGNGDRVLINAGNACAPLTTENSLAILENAEGMPGATVPLAGAYMDLGDPISCDALRQGTNGLQMRGAAIFYGSTIGDLVTGVIVNCE